MLGLTCHPEDVSSGGCVVQGTHHPKDESSKGPIVKTKHLGTTHRPWTAWHCTVPVPFNITLRNLVCINKIVRYFLFFLFVRPLFWVNAYGAHGNFFPSLALFISREEKGQFVTESSICAILIIGIVLKGTVSRNFLLLVFFMNQFPPSPRPEYPIKTISNFFEHSQRFRKSRCTTGINDTGGKLATGVNDTSGLPPVLTTPAANFATSFASVVDTDGKFTTGVSDTGGNFPAVSTTPLANNANNIRLLRP